MSEARLPKLRAPVSIWRFSMKHELAAAVVAALVLTAGSWITLAGLERRYLQLHQNDAERVGYLLAEHLRDARQQLDRFAALPPERQRDSAQLLLPAFSDLYRLDPNHQVLSVLKASPGSRVFPGFSFAGSHIDSYLNQPRIPLSGASLMDRGLEDELASVYFASSKRGSGRLLGRLNLFYLQDFLSRYNEASGLPVLLVSRHGFVLLASDPELQVPAVDVHQIASDSLSARSLHQNNQRWLPLVANNSDLGGHIVTLIPANRLEEQKRLVWWCTLAVGVLALLVSFWKNRRLHQRLFSPVAQFSRQIEGLRTALAKGEVRSLSSDGVPSHFHEVAQIETSFDALMDTIRQRDQTLQQQLRTSLTAAAIAHEINLPLSTIRLLCQQARLQSGRQLDVDALVTNLDAQSQQVSQVIERMRMLLRNVQTDQQPTNLAEVVLGACTLVKPLLREQRVQLSCEGLDGDGPEAAGLGGEGCDAGDWVMGDAGQLQMAVANLLRNGIEALAGQPVERRRLRLRLERRQGSGAAELAVSVADSGPGFAFEPSDDTLFRSTKAAGSGLGLFVVRTTAANHGGRLELGRSPDLGGAEARLVLPWLSQE